MIALALACAHLPEVPDAVEGAVAVEAVVLADPALARLRADATASRLAYERLAWLCDQIGNRLAGSAALDRAVEWGRATFEEDGHENVHTEPVTVPVWVRGEERLRMTAPVERDLAVLALGGSIGTPNGGIEAPVAVVRSFDELGPEVAGHIVLYDVPMPDGSPSLPHYKGTVVYRGQGAARAAAHGAVASLVRSVGPRSLYTPHTGGMQYDDGGPRIPAAALTGEDAGWIARLSDRGVEVRLRLDLGAHVLPDAPSANVVAEVRGSETPEEIVLVGAHLDSWDVGQGAHDDGAGVVEVIEALRRIRSLGTPPRRTIRAVLFTNEENGLRGGKAYAEAHGNERHVAAIESDLGGGRPLAWSATGTGSDIDWLRRVASPLGLPVEEGGGGADISPLEDKKVLVIGLRPDDSHYFDVHHTRADTLDKVDPEALAESAGALAGLAWLLANAER